MTIWTAITAEAISNYLSPIQLAALRQNIDPLNEIINDTVARVRSEIKCNPDDSVYSIPCIVPHEVKMATCHLVIEALQSRIPTLKLSEDQIRNANNARTFLKRIAANEVTVGESSSIETLGNIDVAYMRQRQCSYNTLQGL